MKKSKKRVFLYILIILFTAAMAAEGALVFLGSSSSVNGFDASSFQLPDGASFQMDGTMPQDGDMTFQNGETIPQGGDMTSQSGETMPQGGGEMPQGGMIQDESGTQTGENTEQDGDGQMSGMPNMPSFDTSSLPGSTSSTGILAVLRRYWIPIIAVCLLGDIVCLILLRRDKKAARQAEEAAAAAAAAAADDDDPARRKKKKWWIAPACILLVITLVIASLPSGGTTATQGDTVTVTEEIISGTAEAGTITTVLTGAGTISPETTVSVTIPSVVEVKTYHVQNGDQVYEGDVLATLDTTGLATAIMELQEVLDDLDDDLEDERQTTPSTYVKAPTSGRVKAILAQAGDNAAEVTAQEGALLLLSVDGLMKVEISADNLTVGQTLTVQLENGTSLTGRVNSCRDGTAVVTVSDQTAPYGGKAKVLSTDGTLLGEGTLEINSELKVTCTYGTISSVAVTVNQQVSQSAILFYLKDVGYTQEYQTLLARREELEEQMETLYALYPDGQVIAQTDGIVDGIPDDAEYVALDAEEETITADTLTSQGSWSIVLLSSTDTSEEVSVDTSTDDGVEGFAEGDTQTAAEDGTQTDTGDGTSAVSVDGTGESTGDGTSAVSVDGTGESTGDGTSAVSVDGTGESTGGTTGEITESSTSEGTSVVVDSGTDAGTNEESNSAAAFYARVSDFIMDETGTVRIAAILTRQDDGSRVLFVGIAAEQNGTLLTLESLNLNDLLYVSGDGASAMRIPEQETVEPTPETTPEATTAPVEETTAPAEGESVPGGETDASGVPGDADASGDAGVSGDASAAGDASAVGDASGFSSFSGGTVSSSSGGTGQTTTTQNSYDTYSTATTTVLTLASQETMVIEIPVDELDVLSLTEGSEAQVTLDAVQGQTFTGTVNRISRSGTNSGGNTKYTVEVTLPGSDEMISGMNASVSVTTATTEATITVPAAALYEDGGKTYVYTGYSEKDDTLLNPVEVETGVADADTVEILSGLSVGDTYYYRYASGITYTFTI